MLIIALVYSEQAETVQNTTRYMFVRSTLFDLLKCTCLLIVFCQCPQHAILKVGGHNTATDFDMSAVQRNVLGAVETNYICFDVLLDLAVQNKAYY